MGFGGYNISEEDFRKKVFEVAIKRYPELFRESPDALPIEVVIAGKNSSSAVISITAEILTLAVLGGILPLPISGTSEFTVRTELSGTGLLGKREPVPVIRKDVMWMTVFTPLGLIPIPGETDCDKSCEVGQMKSFRRGGDLTLESFVDAVVVGLNTMDFSKLSADSFSVSNEKIVPRKVEASAPQESIPDRLKRLKQLKDQGAISEQEYQLAREKLVNKL